MAWHSPLPICPAGFQIIVLCRRGQLLTCKAFKTSTKSSYRKFVVCGFFVFLSCLESNVPDLKLCPVKPLALFDCSQWWLFPFPCCQVCVWGRTGEEKGCSSDGLWWFVSGNKSRMAHAGLKQGRVGGWGVLLFLLFCQTAWFSHKAAGSQN